MMRSARLYRWFALMLVVCLALPLSLGYAAAQPAPALLQPGAKLAPQAGGTQDPDSPDARGEWFYAWREAGNPNAGFSLAQAAELRAQAAQQMINAQASLSPLAPALGQFSGAWNPLGPNPTLQLARANSTAVAVSGRVSALAVRSSAPFTIYLGAAQGGVWESNSLTNGWVPLTDNLGSLAIGAIALAPSNEDVIYVGTGEGNLSGDSYFGNGVLKSINAGVTFTHVGGSFFNQVSFSRIVVDPTNPDHVFAAVLSGKSGSRSVSAPAPTPYGIYESTDGGANWTPRMVTTNPAKGATDLVMDPQAPNVLYASFFSQGIYKSIDSGLTCATGSERPSVSPARRS